MEKVEPALVPQRKLSNGMVIPGIGMGTFGNDRFSSEQTADAVYGAIQAGYRLFDCAAAYGNEKDIGKVFEKAFSNGIVQRQDLTIMTKVWEMFMPLNDDAVLHVAPKSGGDVVTELTEAFIVPKGTMVKLDAAVWHLAAMPVNVEELQSLIVLPEGTYMNDCTKVALNDEQKFEIVI